MNNCNVQKKKILAISSNKFSKKIAVLRKIVVQAKTLPLVIVLFKVVILFILCTRKSRLYFAIGKNWRNWFAIFINFSPVFTPRSILEVRTARIIIKRDGNRLSIFKTFAGLGNTGIMRIEVERLLVNSNIDRVTQWHTGINKKKNNSEKSISTHVRVAE